MTKFVGEVVDLFCGVGALSHGLFRAGFDIRAGYDLDAECSFAFEANNKAPFIAANVANVSASEIQSHFTGKLPTVLAGCAPCQPFSTYKQRYAEDPQWDLVPRFAQIATEVAPDFITMENVPALARYKGGAVFSEFISTLENAGYGVSWTIAKCEEYGVPQKRRRLVVLAAKDRSAPSLTPNASAPISVREAIANLPAIQAGTADPADALHASSALSSINLERIRASTPGGTWRQWPEELRAECHRRASGKTYPGVYARMSWDEPAPTMTTQCYGYGNGRFGHPEQDRAISLREAALLQSFPPEYEFVAPRAKLSFTKVGRWIGNAVPVKLAEAIGVAIVNSLGDENNERSGQKA